MNNQFDFVNILRQMRGPWLGDGFTRVNAYDIAAELECLRVDLKKARAEALLKVSVEKARTAAAIQCLNDLRMGFCHGAEGDVRVIKAMALISAWLAESNV